MARNSIGQIHERFHSLPKLKILNVSGNTIVDFGNYRLTLRCSWMKIEP
jgi:Leucine-rich repeat (LRR) protein